MSDPSRYEYFIEGQYVAPDDAVPRSRDNGLNNASNRKVILSDTSLIPTGATDVGRPAIYAWREC